MDKGARPTEADFDAVVVGAGFAGLRMLIELDRLGFSARLFEAGSSVGGTWYWNRYPGARTDSLAWTYCYAFSEELLGDWNWTQNYPDQPEVQSYLNHVADRFGLRRRIQLETEVTSATFDADEDRWIVRTAADEIVTCRYFIPCVGILSAPVEPDFVDPGVFEGEIVHTSRWPAEGLDLTGKRVALVGVGASGVQAAPHLAEQAAHLTVFQRTPNYVLPARYRALDDADRERIRNSYAEIRQRVRVQPWGFDMNLAGRLYDDVTDAERATILEDCYRKGGFFYNFESFDDVATDRRSNEAASDFLRKKIRETVTDAATAELLCPNYPFLAKRPPVGDGYYEVFNRPDVTLVDAKSYPIVSTTPHGLATTRAEYDFDVIVLATGFDAMTGNLVRMDIRGLDRRSLAEEWKAYVRTLYGIGVAGFPNLLMVCGPQAPGGNQPVIIEGIVDFVGSLLDFARDRGIRRVDTTPTAAAQWTTEADDILGMTVASEHFGETYSYITGANVPGKVQQAMFYLGGVGNYHSMLRANAEDGFEGFDFSGEN